MTTTLQQGKDDIARLCAYFSTNATSFRASGIKEAHIRQSLIDPFFEALGWDVGNVRMIAPQYREVVPEDSVEVEGHQQAPDYTFRVGTLSKFYAEAKKCSVNVGTDAKAAYQLRSYGWNGKLPISVLTDFEEFSVYDCATQPKTANRASHSRIQYMGFEEYPDRWPDLWAVFSREAVWSGAFDEYASSKRKRGTTEVDAAFLRDIEGWRETLARNIAIRNRDLTSDDLNAAVQRTIDRIVFLRMAEDRGLEPFEQLLSLCKSDDVYARFMTSVCRKADEKYNSGLFHFRKESGVSDVPDRVTPHIAVDDSVFVPILRSLYFAHGSPYNFRVMPVEILGTVYERFLGKVIRLTPAHQAKVEEKPEVRKAGGVYYTPSFIVNYIVQNTVARQIAGKSPAQLAGSGSKHPFRVIDLACGSGSFLLGAFQCLLDHYLRWHEANHPESRPRAVYRDPKQGGWRLTIGEKKRVLTTHLFGIDIDPQAVEVTKLSLLLHALEGENEASLSTQLALFHERVLPNLGGNIVCGNALLSPGQLDGSLIRDADAVRRLNPLDWKAAFPAVATSGGFDCIIGNPPYVRIQTLRDAQPEAAQLISEVFESAARGNPDLYVAFIERSLGMLRDGGDAGFIVPNKFLRTDYGRGLRTVLARESSVRRVIDFGHDQVFDATIYTCLLFMARAEHAVVEVAQSVARPQALQNLVFARRPSAELSSEPWVFADDRVRALAMKLSNGACRLIDLPAEMNRGSSSGDDSVFIIDPTVVPVEAGITRVPLFATGFSRYSFTPDDTRRIIFPYAKVDDGYRLYSEAELAQQFPQALAHLRAHADRLKARKQYRAWYGFSAPRSLELHDRAQMAIPLLADRGLCSAIPSRYQGLLCPMAGGGFTISLQRSARLKPAYLLALLNSKLLFWRLRWLSNVFRGGWVTCTKQYVGELPIRAIRRQVARDVELHDELAELALARTTISLQADNEVTRRQCEEVEERIDRAVYELYELTAEEIALVEETE